MDVEIIGWMNIVLYWHDPRRGIYRVDEGLRLEVQHKKYIVYTYSICISFSLSLNQIIHLTSHPVVAGVKWTITVEFKALRFYRLLRFAIIIYVSHGSASRGGTVSSSFSLSSTNILSEMFICFFAVGAYYVELGGGGFEFWRLSYWLARTR